MRAASSASRRASGRLLRRLLFLLSAVHVVACIHGCADGDREDQSGDNGSGTLGADDESVGDDYSSYPAFLSTLKALRGGVWVGQADGVRIILKLPSAGELRNNDPETPRSTAWLAVLREGVRPRVFAVFNPVASPEKRAFGMSLTSMGRDTTSGTVQADGVVDDSRLRILQVLGDDAGIFPPQVELVREVMPVGDDEARLRRRWEDIALGRE